MPRENTAVGHHRCWEMVLQEIMNEIDSMAHPLVGNTTGKILIEPKLEIGLRVKGPIGL